MSLQVWLPLNGHIQNQGLSEITTSLINNPTVTVSNRGLCYNFNPNNENNQAIELNIPDMPSWLQKECSISFWIFHNETADRSIIFGNYEIDGMLSFNIEKKASTNQLRIYMNAAPDYSTANCTLDENVWTHIVIVKSLSDLKLYKNGNLVATRIHASSDLWANANGTKYRIGRDNRSNATSLSGMISDFKIYNHCLSIQEVERDYSCLLIHYPLRDPYVENTENLLPQPKSEGLYTENWDASLHPNAIKVSGWSDGYNGGVSNPTTTQHAYWNLIDDIPTVVMNDNGVVSWMGVSSNSSKTLLPAIGIGNSYTISFEAKSNVNGKMMNVGLYYTNTSGSTNFHDQTADFNLTTEWKTYSMTKVLGSAADLQKDARVYIYGHTGSTAGIVYVRNIQMEAKDHSTAFTISNRSNEPVYDCSGRGHNSVDRGNLIVKSNSSRNSYYTHFTPDNAIKIPSPYGSTTYQMTDFSVAMWINLTDAASSLKSIFTTRYGENSSGQAGWLSVNTEGKTLWFYNSKYHGAGSTALPANEWHHIAITYKNGTAQWYLDGEIFGNPITDDLGYVNAYSFFSLGDAYTKNTTTSWYGSPFTGAISDFRFYGTAIPATIIKDLYKNSATIDSQGNIHAFEYMEV